MAPPMATIAPTPNVRLSANAPRSDSQDFTISTALAELEALGVAPAHQCAGNIRQAHGMINIDWGSTRKIPLSNSSKCAIVDVGDFDLVARRSWRLNPSGYAMRTERADGRRYTALMHRLIIGVPRGVLVDHANGDGLDNRRSNLRACTQSQNSANARPRRGTASKYKGISWNREQGYWHAAIRVHGKAYHLGCFRDEVEAALAYDAAARVHFGEFARPNFPLLARGA